MKHQWHRFQLVGASLLFGFGFALIQTLWAAPRCSVPHFALHAPP